MDYLEKQWSERLERAGMAKEDAMVVARIKAQAERDKTLLISIKEGGFEGFCRWVEINCRDIFEKVKNALQSVWNWLKEHC